MKFVTSALSVSLLGLLLFASGCTAAGDSRPSGEPYLFTLKNLEGADMSLGSLLKEKKAVLINFWATWCPPCREEIPNLITLQDQYRDSGFTILGVDVGESKAKVSNFVKKFGINYPVVLDSQMAVAMRYNVVGIPTSILVNSEGKILGQYHAYTTKMVADIEKALQ